MKYIVIDTEQQVVDWDKHPQLVTNGQVVVLTSPNQDRSKESPGTFSGTQVSSDFEDEDLFAGEYCSSWFKDGFVKFNGIIKLSND